MSMQNAFANLVMLALVAFLGYLCGTAVKYLKKDGQLTELETKKVLVMTVVASVEQLSGELESGLTKSQRARIQIIDRFKEHKLNYTESELSSLIEEAVLYIKVRPNQETTVTVELEDSTEAPREDVE